MAGHVSVRFFRSTRRWRALPLIALILCLARPAAAQFVSTASIDGTVTDPSGAALPGVSVTLKSSSLQVPQLDTVTNSEGLYRFTQLPAGSYQVHFALSGFQSVSRDDLQIGAGFAAKLDMTSRSAPSRKRSP